jgi:hypothetical protein
VAVVVVDLKEEAVVPVVIVVGAVEAVELVLMPTVCGEKSLRRLLTALRALARLILLEPGTLRRRKSLSTLENGQKFQPTARRRPRRTLPSYPNRRRKDGQACSQNLRLLRLRRNRRILHRLQHLSLNLSNRNPPLSHPLLPLQQLQTFLMRKPLDSLAYP